MIPFHKLKEDYISIQFNTPRELNFLIDKLKEKGLQFGTWNGDLDEIKYLGFQYFSANDRYLTIEQSMRTYKRPFICCGKIENAKVYSIYDIDWNNKYQKESSISNQNRLLELKNGITIQQLVDICNSQNISLDTPIFPLGTTTNYLMITSEGIVLDEVNYFSENDIEYEEIEMPEEETDYELE